ncbi:hypothetical protein QR680_013248 [Steinernema hermaphroditum]|uniref:F-box/SPRY domain-containing protein 1 n=1 Tax=Steinernema hermaphroditum TaxID=289476 RepID=A0AA39I4V5_9BILA|nr:hypothetical protein QR680_013248 [Steinernema hermaphroditum]
MPEAKTDAASRSSLSAKLESAVATSSEMSTLKPARRPRAVSAARLPHHILAVVFQHLHIKDLASCMRVCRHWNAVLEYQDNYIWEYQARREVPESALADPYLLSDVQSFKEKLRAFRFAWSPRDLSRNNYIRPNGFTVHRQPVAQSTDGVRGKIGVSAGVHCWELAWEGPLGTVAVIGIATRHAALHCQGYMPLLGSDDQSWGWNLVDNSLIHNGNASETYPRFNNPPKYQVYFEKGSEFLGLAFSDLPPVKLFPAMCAVYGNTEVSMVYLGAPLVG